MSHQSINHQQLAETVKAALEQPADRGYAHASVSADVRHAGCQRDRTNRSGGTDALGRRRTGDVSLSGRRGISRRARDEASVRAVLEDEQDAAGRPYLEKSFRRADADQRGLPGRAHDAATARAGSQRKIARCLSSLFRQTGPEQIYRPGDGDRQRLVDHDDQSGFRRQRAEPLAEESSPSQRIHGSKPCCGSTRCCGPGRPPPSSWANGAIKVSEEISAGDGRGSPPIPARMDRPAEGDLSGGQPSAGIPLSNRLRPDRIGGTDDSGKSDPAGLRRARIAVRHDDRLPAARESRRWATPATCPARRISPRSPTSAGNSPRTNSSSPCSPAKTSTSFASPPENSAT